MAISLHTEGSWVAANATTQVVTLPAHSTGDLLIVRVGMKHATLPGDITCGTAGWARIDQHNNGTTASGNGSGDVQVAAFWKIAASASETNPTITFHASVAATPSAAVATAYAKGAGEVWNDPVADGGSIAAATSYTATMGSHVAAAAGDWLVGFAVTNDNTTLTVPTMTQTGLTLAAVVESPATALSSATSNDISADGCHRSVTSGTSSAAAVFTGTNSVADVGAAMVIRLRAFTPEVHTGTVTATGGGVGVIAAVHHGLAAVTATASGIASVAQATARAAALALTGGGTAASTSSSSHGGSVNATGGGIGALTATAARTGTIAATAAGIATLVSGKSAAATIAATGAGAAVAVGAKFALGTITATTSGTATVAQTTTRSAAAIATGGGTAALEAVTARGASVSATGGGAAAVVSVASRFWTVLATGGGTATSEQATARASVVSVTGGGIATISGAAGSGESHSGSVVATGGGSAAIAWAPGHASSIVATGSGGAALATGTARFATVIATGGGRALVTGTRPGISLPVLIVLAILARRATGASIAGASVSGLTSLPDDVTGTITPVPDITAEVAQ